MRKLLMIAFDFPPLGGVGGGLRSFKFARYLPEHGWQPRIVAFGETPPNELLDLEIIRLTGWTPWSQPYEVRAYGWGLAIARRLRALTRDCDLIYISCPPFPPAALIAQLGRPDLPLVIDLRDAWSLDPYQEGSRLKRLLHRTLFPAWERLLFKRVDLLLCNTPSMLAAYRDSYPWLAKRMHWLPNGYDERDFADQTPAYRPAGRERLRLLYTGRFGIGARSPSRLLAALRQANTRGWHIELEIVGAQFPDIQTELAAASAAGWLRVEPAVPHQQAIARMCQADALLLFQANTQARVQAIAGKTFEYLRSGRPILAVTPAGDNRRLVERWAGQAEFAEDDTESLLAALGRLWQRWSRGEFDHSADRHPDYAAQYERLALSQRLAEHFERLAAARRG